MRNVVLVSAFAWSTDFLIEDRVQDGVVMPAAIRKASLRGFYESAHQLYWVLF